MRKSALLTALAAGAGALAAASALPAAAPRSAAPAARDWTRNVAMTPEGGFRMGNPQAPVKLVEYGSMTCGHCADFAAAAKAPIAAQVRSGKLSFEFRNLVLNGIDVTASLVARCAGPTGFFPLTDRLYTSQQTWVGRISGLPQAQKDELKALSAGQRLVRLAELGGITKIAGEHGVTPQKAAQCLSDEAALQRLGAMAEAAAAQDINGTPTFLVNGKRVEAHDWSSLEPLLKPPGR